MEPKTKIALTTRHWNLKSCGWQPRKRQISLDHLLSEIPAAADIFLSHLLGGSSFEPDFSAIPAARLSCRSICKYVDENIKALRIHVSDEDVRRWPELQPPSLARWPSCSQLQLGLCVSDDNVGPDFLASLVSLPFMNLPLEARQRIRNVQLWVELPSESAAEGYRGHIGTAVLALTSHLPSIVDFTVKRSRDLLWDPFQLQLMYNSLASLPHLEALCLPEYGCLDRIGTLGASAMKELHVGTQSGAAVLSSEALAGLASLQHLEVLYVYSFQLVGMGDGQRFARLLSSVPPSVRELGLCQPVASLLQSASGRSLVLRLANAQVQFVGMGSGEECLHIDAVSTMAKALLACEAAQLSQLQEVCVDRLRVPDFQTLSHPDQQPFLELMRRSKQLNILSLRVDDLDSVVPVVRVLGKPFCLLLPACGDLVLLDLRTEEDPRTLAPGQHQQQQEQDGSKAGLPPYSGSLPDGSCAAWAPDAAEVLRRMVQVLMTGRWLPTSQTGGGGPAAGGEASCSGNSGGRSSGSGSGRSSSGSGAGSSLGGGGPLGISSGLYPTVLLLRGELLELLMQTPNELLDWLMEVLDEAALKSASGTEAKEEQPQVGRYLVLPAPAKALLLHCGSEAAATAVAAVLRSMAAGRPSGALDVAPVAVRYQHRKVEDDQFALAAYLDAMRAVLQGIWDNRVQNGAAAALGEEELLRRLVELVRQLGGELPGGQLGQEEATPQQSSSDEPASEDDDV